MKINFTKKFIFLWLPAFVWAGIIFYLSNQSGLRVGLSTPNEILVRKVAHATEFGMLAWLVWRIMHYGFSLKTKKAVIFSIILTVLYALSDEFHQMFVMDRKGKLGDVAVDSLSAVLVLQIIVPIYVHKFKIWMIAGLGITAVLLVLLVGQMVFEAKETAAQRKTDLNSQMKIVRQNKAEPELATVQENNIGTGEEAQGNEQVSIETTSSAPISLPTKVLIDVPFTSQAPFAVWDHVHDEACEEASLIMVKYFLDNKQLSPRIAENEIQQMKEYQLKKSGHYDDSNMKELVEIAKGHYGLANLDVLYDFTEAALKSELAKGNPIIVPTAGRDLGNPFFTQPGPLYHNLVLIGYERNVIIVNDPGTKRGKQFKYDSSVLFSAIHDFPGSKERIREGRKAMIVIR